MTKKELLTALVRVINDTYTICENECGSDFKRRDWFRDNTADIKQYGIDKKYYKKMRKISAKLAREGTARGIKKEW